MKPLELCDPLFQYVCELNRKGRKGSSLQVRQVESELEDLFLEMRARASSESNLGAQYDKLEAPLLFFVDNIISNGSTNIAGSWPRLAFKRDMNNGDAEFFEILDQTLAERSTAADERLAVYYVCIGLGFTGWYTVDNGGPEKLKTYMLQIESRIKREMNLDDRGTGKITPQAYEALRTDDLITEPVQPITKVIIAFAVLVIVMIAMNAVMYKTTTTELNDALIKVTTLGR